MGLEVAKNGFHQMALLKLIAMGSGPLKFDLLWQTHIMICMLFAYVSFTDDINQEQKLD